MYHDEWTLDQLVKHVDHSLLHLPAFQRTFNWKTNDVVTLFDSLLRQIPVGALTLAVPNFSIGVASIDTRKGKEKGKVPDYKWVTPKQFESFTKAAGKHLGSSSKCYLILDGQQRVTSIYRALMGYERIYLAFKRSARDCADVAQIRNKLEKVTSEETASHLHVPLKMVGHNRWTDQHLKAEFLRSRYAVDGIRAADRDKEAERYRSLVRDLAGKFLTECKLPLIIAESNEADLIEFFQRSNTKGTVLDFFDLMNAKTFQDFGGSGKRPGKDSVYQSFSKAVAKEFKKIPNELKKFGSDREAKEHFVRARCFDELKKTKIGKKNPLAKDTILEFARGKHIRPEFDKWVGDFFSAVKWLQTERLTTHHDKMPFPLMVVPVFWFLKELDFDFEKIGAEKREFIHWWYWASVFSERYSYLTNEAAWEDIDVLRGVAKGKKQVTKKYLTKLHNQLDTTVKVLSVKDSGHYQKGILQLAIFTEKSKDLFSGAELSSLELGTKDRKAALDRHHIFPSDYISKKGLKTDYPDSVCNVMYATRTAHGGISDPPSAYLAKGYKKRLKPSALKTHFVSSKMYRALLDGSYDDDFESFLHHRADLICKAIIKEAGPRKKGKATKAFMR